MRKGQRKVFLMEQLLAAPQLKSKEEALAQVRKTVGLGDAEKVWSVMGHRMVQEVVLLDHSI